MVYIYHVSFHHSSAETRESGFGNTEIGLSGKISKAAHIKMIQAEISKMPEYAHPDMQIVTLNYQLLRTENTNIDVKRSRYVSNL